MDCKAAQNAANCGCSYTTCGKRGVCCECLVSHLADKELPGCCFPPDAEKSYDRSFANFAKAWGL